MSKKNFFYYKQNEELIVDSNKLFLPNYSTKDAEKLFEILIEDFKTSKYYKKLYIDGVNIFSIIFQDLFWHYCFNYVKYKEVLLTYDVNNLHFKQQNKFDNLGYGLNRVFSFIKPVKISFFSIKILIKSLLLKIISILFIFNFILKNFLKKNFNQIWIYPDLYFHNNFKFLKPLILKNNNYILIDQKCFLTTDALKFFFKDINHSIYKECKIRTKKCIFWELAIKILKPKKIILQDNLFNDFSILLAAKKNKIETIGVIHGLMTKYHKGNIGSVILKDTKLLKFDKIYVWTEEFKYIMDEHSFLYNKEETLVSGWLSSKYGSRKKNNTIFTSKNDKYVLHAFEINSNFIEINKILNFFQKKGYKNILKKRYPYKNYTHFDNIFDEIVDEFTKEQVEKSFCAICNASTFYYNYLNMQIPIVLINQYKDGYNFFNHNDKNIFEFSSDVEDKIKKSEYFQFNLPNLTKSFLKEFE